MLVVVGSPVLGPAPDGPACNGLAGRVAAAAAAAGASVQLVGRIGDDDAGDALVLALGTAEIGHVAVLRDAAHATPVMPAGPAVDLDAIDPGGDPGDDPDAGQAVSSPIAAPTPSVPLTGLPLDAGDVALGLRYLVDFRVVVATDPLDDEAAAVIAEAARFAGAAVIAVVEGSRMPPAFETATVLARPTHDPDGRFAGVVGRYAAALERGDDPASAFHAATAELGWETAPA
jgi:hypothetical protein